MEQKTRIGWHFVGADGHLRHDKKHIIAEVGLTVEVDCHPMLCVQGLHASCWLTDALEYAQSNILCLVKLDGNMVFGQDKVVATKRTILAMLDVDSMFHKLAFDIALDGLRESNEYNELYAALHVCRDNFDCKDEASTARYVSAHLRIKNYYNDVMRTRVGGSVAICTLEILNPSGVVALLNAVRLYHTVKDKDGGWYGIIKPINNMLEAKVLEAMQYEIPAEG